MTETNQDSEDSIRELCIKCENFAYEIGDEAGIIKAQKKRREFELYIRKCKNEEGA